MKSGKDLSSQDFPEMLLKIVASRTALSRRAAIRAIESGKVFVEGTCEKNPFKRVSRSAQILFNGREIEELCDYYYLALNKPAGYITTRSDTHGRKIVTDLIRDFPAWRLVYPVGRLDKDTTGILLFTNDGDLTYRLTHPKFFVRKEYRVTLNKKIKSKDFFRLSNGVELHDGFIKPDLVAIESPDKTVVRVVIHSGKKRIVRRIFRDLGYKVAALDRTFFAGISYRGLSVGKWRLLSSAEISLLKRL